MSSSRIYRKFGSSNIPVLEYNLDKLDLDADNSSIGAPKASSDAPIDKSRGAILAVKNANRRIKHAGKAWQPVTPKLQLARAHAAAATGAAEKTRAPESPVYWEGYLGLQESPRVDMVRRRGGDKWMGVRTEEGLDSERELKLPQMKRAKARLREWEEGEEEDYKVAKKFLKGYKTQGARKARKKSQTH